MFICAYTYSRLCVSPAIMDAGLQALFWFVLKKRIRNSRLTARVIMVILQRSASEIMHHIRKKNKAYGSPINSPCIALHIRKAASPRHGVTERYRKKGERLHVEKKNKNVGTEPFFMGSVPKGVHSRLWTFLGTERIKLERFKYRLHVKFCRSRSSFYPSRSIFFGRVNGPEIISFLYLSPAL